MMVKSTMQRRIQHFLRQRLLNTKDQTATFCLIQKNAVSGLLLGYLPKFSIIMYEKINNEYDVFAGTKQQSKMTRLVDILQ